MGEMDSYARGFAIGILLRLKSRVLAECTTEAKRQVEPLITALVVELAPGLKQASERGEQ